MKIINQIFSIVLISYLILLLSKELSLKIGINLEILFSIVVIIGIINLFLEKDIKIKEGKKKSKKEIVSLTIISFSVLVISYLKTNSYIASFGGMIIVFLLNALFGRKK